MIKRCMLGAIGVLTSVVIAACGSAPAAVPASATSVAGDTSAATSTSGGTRATSAADDTSATTAATGNTIIDVAAQQGTFTTLLTALQITGLDQQLSQAGEYTVFAPTDAAFAALPPTALQALLADPTLLGRILSYHVVQGAVPAAEVTTLSTVSTLEGQPIQIAVDGSMVKLNGNATVTTTDIQTSNGVIHVIDQVLLPPDVTLPAGS